MGRTSIYLVMGFNIIFAILGFNLSRVSNDAYENYVRYYSSTLVHNIAASAANMACNEIFMDPMWRDGFTNVPFSGGTFSVELEDLSYGKLKIEATAEHGDQEAQIIILLGKSRFSKFAYYSMVEGGIYWVTGDTVWGPVHTEHKLTVTGDPVFYGKVTTRVGLFKNPQSSQPKFYGGFESGVSIDIPNDLYDLATVAQSGGRYFADTDVWLEFNADGTVNYKEGSGGSWNTIALSSFAPNGVIITNKGNLHIKGTLNGKVTVGALGSSGLGYGNVIIDDDIVYAGDYTSEDCDDLLGVVVDNNVIVAENAENNSDVNIHASLFCRTGGLTAENYNTRPVSGTIYLYGGVQQYQRGAVGQFSGSTIIHGFQKNYTYDSRLMLMDPPYYPRTGKYEILSWYE